MDYLMLNETKAARPNCGRPLQKLARRLGFVAASPSRVFRDGEGIFRLELSEGTRHVSIKTDEAESTVLRLLLPLLFLLFFF